MIQARAIKASIGRAPRAAACSFVQHMLYSVESGARAMPSSLERHRSSCLACQTETVRQRQVLRGLADLGATTEVMPGDLSADLDSSFATMPAGQHHVDPFDRRRLSRTTIASAASLAAIGAVVIAGRRVRSLAS